MSKILLLFFYLAALAIFPLQAQNAEAQTFYEEGLRLYWMVNNIEAALEQFNAAIEADESFADAYAYRSYATRAIFYRQENAEVEADFQKAIELAPEGVMGYVVRSRYAYDLGNMESAMQDIEYALSLDAEHPIALYHLGLYLAAQEQHDQALVALEKITDPYPSILSVRGWAYYIVRRLDEALADFSAAIAQRPTSSEYYRLRGAVYLLKAEGFDPIDESLLSLAEDDYNHSIALSQNNPWAFNDIGVIYMHRGDFVTALDYYDHALALASDYETALINGNNVRERAQEQAAQGMVSQLQIPATVTPTAPSLVSAVSSATPLSASPTEVAAAPAPVQAKNGLIAFISTRDAYTEIYVMNPNGSLPTRLTNNSAYDEYPKWSPDGEHIAFVSNRDGNAEIYVMEADGSNQTKLTANPETDLMPSWSPDGEHIVFASNRDGNYNIYVMTASGGSPQRLTDSPVDDFYPAWSPDGSKIAFASDRKIYIMNADGTNATRLLSDPDSSEDAPAWSPDGTQLALSYNRKIHLVNRDGTNLRELTTNVANASNYETNPVWSPDGTQIVFTYNLGYDGEIYVVSAEGGRSRSLTNLVKDDKHPSWQPVLDGDVQEIQPTATPVIPTSTPVNTEGIIYQDFVSGYPAVDGFNCTFRDTSYVVQALAGDTIEATAFCNAASSCSVFIQSTTHGFAPPPVQSPRWIGGGDPISYVAPEDGNYIIGVEGTVDLDMRQEYCQEAFVELDVTVRRD